jgi:hypothetical protein
LARNSFSFESMIFCPAKSENRKPDPHPAGADAADWLTYRHWRCVLGAGPRTEEYPVLDNDGYNQTESRQLHRVTDLLLVCYARLPKPSGVLFFKVHNGADWFFVALDFNSRQAQLHRRERLLASDSLPPAAYAQRFRVELALCDQQVLLAIDGQVLIVYPYEAPAVFNPKPRSVGIGAEGVELEIHRLQVFRDLYYLDPLGLGRDWSSARRLDHDEVFVVGDNVPISQDSRHWSKPGVARDRLLGRVIRLK